MRPKAAQHRKARAGKNTFHAQPFHVLEGLQREREAAKGPLVTCNTTQSQLVYLAYHKNADMNDLEKTDLRKTVMQRNLWASLQKSFAAAVDGDQWAKTPVSVPGPRRRKPARAILKDDPFFKNSHVQCKAPARLPPLVERSV